MKYRKKPVVIEAFQMTRERRESNAEWPLWLNAAWNKNYGETGALFPCDYPRSDGNDKLCIFTLKGVKVVHWNDWIIRDMNGELERCKPDIFEKTYEPVK